MFVRPFMNSWFPWFGIWLPLLLLIVVVEIILKGVALYRSARNGQKYWFVALLLINTVGILPLIYLIWFADKEKETPVKPRVTPSRARRGRNK